MIQRKKVPTEKELVKSIKLQERGAFEMLYKMYSKNLLYAINKIIADNELKYDILQEVMTKIWHQAGNYNDTKGKFYTWMINVTRNYTYDVIRSRRYINSKKNMNIDDVHSAENKIITNYNPDTIDLKNLIAKLRPEEKEIFELFYMQGYTHSEIAEILGLPLGTVKTRITMGIKALRKQHKYYNPFHAVADKPLNEEDLEWVSTKENILVEEHKDLKEDILVIDEPLQKVFDKPTKKMLKKPLQKVFDESIKKEPDLFDMIWFGLMTPQETAKKLDISLRSARKLFEMSTKKLEYSLNDYKKTNEEHCLINA